MNVCDINDNKELADSIADYINASIQESLNAKTPFEIITVLDDVFNAVNEGEETPAKALGAATMVPQLFFEVLDLEKGLSNGLADQNYDIRVVKALEKQIAESKDPLKLIEEIINKKKIPTVKELADNNLIPAQTPPNIVNKIVGNLKEFSNKLLSSLSMFNTTGRSVIKTTAFSVNKQDVSKALDYKVLQNILIARTDKPFEETEYSGYKGFKLKAILETDIPNPTRNLYPGSTPTNSVIATVVNNKGEYYYFNAEGKITTSDKGKIVYFPLKSTDQSKINEIVNNLVDRSKPAILKDSQNDPIKYADRLVKAEEYYKKQIEKEALTIKNIEASVRKGDNVLLKITGGSLGVIDNPDKLPNKQLKGMAERPLSKFKISDEVKRKIYFDNYEITPGFFITAPAIKLENYGQLITLKGLKLDSNPEVLNKVVDVLVDDLVYADGKKVSPEDKVRLGTQFASFSEKTPGYKNLKKLSISSIDNNLVIKIGDNVLNLSNKEESKSLLKDYLSKEAFFTYVKNDLTDKLDLYENFYISNGTLTVKQEPYRSFIFDYLIPRVVYNELTGEPMVNNGYFSFELDNIEEVIQKETNEVLAKSEKVVNKKKKDDLKGLSDLLERSKLIAARANAEQKIAADAWIAEASIFKAKDKDGKPVLTVKDARNIVNSDAFATFANATITLYSGYNSTYMYHEAWHAFSQMYLTYDERTNKLYKPASNLEGSFSVVRKFGGPGGNTVQRVKVNFADLKADLESTDPDVVAQARQDLEEFIAEEFRKYAMNNGKFKVKDAKSSVFEKIFSRIWNFLKALFKGTLPVNVYSNPGSAGVFSEMFNALYTAKKEEDLNMYMPSINNAEFGTLNLGIMAPNGRTLLSQADAELLTNSIDGIISEATTDLILGDPSINMKPKYGAALQIFSNPKTLSTLYNVVVKKELTLRLKELLEEKKNNESSWTPFERDYHINNIRILHQGLKHFGNLESIVNNKTAENSLVAYHLQNSAFKESIKKSIIDPTDVDLQNLTSYLSKTTDKDANSVSSEKLATSNALYIVQSLIEQEYDADGDRVNVLNSLGFPQTIDFLQFWNFLMKKVSGEQNIEDLYAKMVKVANLKLNPLLEQLLVKLGDPNVNGVEDKNAGNIWLGILNSLNLTNVDLINFVARGGVDENKRFEYDVTVGKVSADYFKIKNNVWKNKFSTELSKYVELSPDKENILKLDVVVKDFLTKNLDATTNVYKYSLRPDKSPIDFFRAIGIYMSDNYEIKNGIDNQTVIQIADAIGQAALNQAVIKNIVKYFDESHKINVEKLVNGKTEYVTSVIQPLTTRINTLAELEAEYSTEFGSQMKPVPGGLKSVYSLNSTLSKIIYGIKKAAGIDELIDYNGKYGYLPHLHPKNNPSLKGSVYHKNLFDGSGKKREDAELEMFELIGGQVINTDGTMEAVPHKKMTNGDKFKTDLFSFLAEGYMEAVRSAGKSTYYASRMNKIITYARKKSPHLFIDTEAFIKNKNGNYIFGVNPIDELNKIMFPKLEGELRRIVKINNGITEQQAIDLGLDPKDAKNFYKNNVKGFEFGGKFDWFHDILETAEGGQIKDRLISEFGPKLTDTNNIEELLNEDLNFKFLIEERIESYFTNYKDRLRKDYDDIYKKTKAKSADSNQSKYIVNLPAYLSKLATKNLSNTQISTLDNEAIVDGLLMSYAVNSALHSDEIITIQFGDGFQFNHEKNEGSKRIPTYNSPGKIFSSDNITKNILNTHYGRPYEAKLIAEGKISKKEVRSFEKVGNKFIIAEPVKQTFRYDSYHDLFLNNLKKRNYSKDEIKELMYGIKDGKYGTKDKPFGGSIMDTYNKIKYADGQGMISFDYYRLLHVNEDNWSPAQEEAFQKEIKGEFIAPQDLIELFPVYKLQHAGPLATPLGVYPIQSIDKFALLPAIPSLIKDSNYEIIHNQMVNQDGDYMLFDSGAKRSYIRGSKESNGDQIYEGTTGKLKPEFVNGTMKLTKNPFFVDYLKNQTEVNNYFKEESTLSTQLRKVFNTGLYEKGLPIDYTGTKEEWNKLSYRQQLETSRIHRKTEAVFNRLEKLVNVLKSNLLDEMGVNHIDDVFKLDEDSINNMITYLRKKLKAQGYSDHEIDSLQSDNGKAPDLSVSPFAPRFEKLLMAIINNKLVRIKLFGEAYVQISSAFFEPFTNPTEEQKALYDDFGQEGGYVVDVNGKENTSGCKVKVALTDNYKNLYKTFYYVKDENGNYVNSGETIAVYEKVEGKKNKVLNEQASFDRLNEMLKVQEWKNDDNNRKKIQITGVRIPTQGPNSVEFAEIWQFLPPAAGPIIIIPAEVVAKSGGDFDVDKLTMYIKRISRQGSLIEDTYNKPEDIQPEIEKLEAKLKELKSSKLAIDNYLEKFRRQVYYAFNYVEMTDEQKRLFTTRDNKKLLEGLNDPENQKFLKRSIKKAYKIYEKNIKSFDVNEYEDVEGIVNDLYGKNSELAKVVKKLSDLEDHQTHFASAIENSLVDDMIQVLELPEMAFSLLLPNGTYLVKKYADELKESVQISDNKTNFEKSIQTGKKISDVSVGISPTRLREVDFNRRVQQDNIAGKDVLGIFALDTPFNNLNNMAGTAMESQIVEEVFVPGQKDLKKLVTPIYLKLNHNYNESTEAGRKLLEISLSNLTDAEKKNQIADVFNQLMNGAVDVEKDPWIAYVQGNMEIVPKMVFLLQAGVPFKDLAYFFTNPMIREYVRKSQEAKAPLGQLTFGPNYSPYKIIKNFKDIYTRPAKTLVADDVLYADDTLYELYKMLEVYTQKIPDTDIFNIFDTESLREVAFSSFDSFSAKDLTNNIPQKQLAGFLQYLYVEKLIEDYDFMKGAINVDTNVTNTTYMASAKLRDLKKADKMKTIKKGALDYHVNKGPLRSFHVQQFSLDLIGDTFFPSRSNKKLNDFLLKISERIPGQMSRLKQIEKQTGYDEEAFEPKFKNAVSLYAFTNSLGQYKEGDTLYNGKPISEILSGNSPIKSINEIVTDFESKKYSQTYKEADSYLKRGLYPIPDQAVRNLSVNDFIDVTLEREYLRKFIMPLTATLVKSKEFRLTKSRLLKIGASIFSKMNAEDVNKLVYENMLMHTALLNTYNNWEMFQSGDNTVAQRLIDIIDNYGKDIKHTYKPLLERFGLDAQESSDKINPRRNFYIKNMKEIEKISGYYNQIWKDLANPSKPKLMGETPEVLAANAYISNFFDKLPIFAFLQTGMDAGTFNMSKIMPTDRYSPIMERATKEFNDKQLTKKESDLILEGILNLFLRNNNIDIKTLRGRGVTYKRSIADLIKDATGSPVNIYSSPFVERLSDNVYQLNDSITEFGRTVRISDNYIKDLKNAHPNATFLLTDKDFNITFNLSTPEELEQAKTNIDSLINDLKLSDNPIVISSKGFGQSAQVQLQAPASTVNNPAEYTNHSGGAKGYDAEWDLIGAEFGMVNNKHYLLPSDGAVSDPRLQAKGVKPVDATNDVGPVALQGPATGEAQIAVTNAERAMGRIEPNHTTRNTKKIRNYAQVKNADGIFAIGSLIPKGADITVARGQATKKALVPQVNGGTSVAVQLGITMDKPTYVFNQVANNTYSQGWYKWDNAKQDFVSINTPTLTKNFAGIGTSSNTTEAGKQAIRDVYANTFKTQPQAAVSQVKPGVPELFESNPELANIGTPKQYSQYLDTIFPDSKVKDIVYHGSYTKIDKFLKEFLGKNTRAESAKKGFFFSSSFKNSLEYIKDILKQNHKLAFDGVVYLDLNKASREIANKFYSKVGDKFDDDFNGILIGDELNNLPSEVKTLPIFSFGILENEGNLTPYSSEFLSYEDTQWRLNQLSDFQIAFKDSGKSFENFIKDYVHFVVLNVKNPLITSDNNSQFREDSYSNRLDKAVSENKDSLIIKDTKDPLSTNVLVVLEPEQIHILGNKQDIEAFKEFVKSPKAPVETSSLNQELSLYLSEQLDKNLGYTNPGSTVVPSIKDIVNNMPNITQADINNKKFEC